MFEYHGWITVRETAADDDDQSRLRQIVDELRLSEQVQERTPATTAKLSEMRDALRRCELG
ncbi:Imm7 family immunity protein [Streptomyces cyaneofuscatus]|uniref:Imm7 family immunity protein n=1 Tax=Streptomyces cyaneofuscatus TaxID=66883 RepID=UPI0033CCA4CB